MNQDMWLHPDDLELLKSIGTRIPGGRLELYRGVVSNGDRKETGVDSAYIRWPLLGSVAVYRRWDGKRRIEIHPTVIGWGYWGNAPTLSADEIAAQAEWLANVSSILREEEE